MPYIDKDKVKEIRDKLKKELPEFKFSVRREHHMEVAVNIMKGPIEFPENYKRVNHYHCERFYEDRPEIVDVFRKILATIEGVEPQRELVYDQDYGSVPNYYISLSVGKWDKPYEKTRSKEEKTAEKVVNIIENWKKETI
jgi:hypothetical protein